MLHGTHMKLFLKNVFPLNLSLHEIELELRHGGMQLNAGRALTLASSGGS